ncbi:daunorubicin resistance ABC transporter, inner membrane subunit B [Ammonifex degensii KC4]|uniref:Transport permease protein n=1 Tax=Ammonifex degensii (strain DSM 10501 / KC4) TaxID=429009 RepID=C9RBT0_AMMDK|nr:ABC transporter permease [Ammonifex degensii]ACX51707.1 daunorubicin resistance ABC transporter, inner membrane subunit B [Ammonifex degensii KC4]
METAIRTVYTIWLREWLRFLRERSRIIGMIGQPLLYFLIVGQGISAAMAFRAAPPGVNLSYLQFMYPGILAMSVLFTSIFSGISIIWDREFGFLKEVLVAPVPRWAIALGKALGASTVALCQAAILLALAPLAQVHLTLPLIGKLLAVLFLISLAITFLGVAIASRMETMEGFQMIMNFLVMPLYFLSGAMFPLTNVPAWMSTLMHFDPLTYGVDALRHLIFAGAHPQVLAFLVHFSFTTDLLVLASMVLVLGGIGSWFFSRQV